MRKLLSIIVIVLLQQSLEAQNFDFAIQTLDGKKTTLDQQLSKNGYTVISFWATWCKPCLEELTIFNDLYEEWKENYNTEIIALSQDNVRSADHLRSFVRVRDWEFPVFSDPNATAQRQLSFSSIPYLIVLDKDKKVVYKSTGYTAGSEEKIEAIISQ